MGYDLPVAIGSQYISPNKLVICFVGDGSFQMNLQYQNLLTEWG